MLIAQFTDTHVVPEGGRASGVVDTNARLAAAIDTLNGLHPRPDCLLITGDLADQGAPEEYRVLAELLARVEMPYYVGIGNHDHRPTMLEELDVPALDGVGRFVQYAVDEHDVRLLFLDSTSDEHHMGDFCDERRAWLDDRLSEDPERPTLVTIHHPPFDTGIAFLDGLGAGWADGLVDTLSRHPNVVLVASGHVHRSIQTMVGGRLATVCPSTAQQTVMDLAERPSADSIFVLEPAGFQIHRFTGGSMVTHTVPVGDYEGVIHTTAEARARWTTMDISTLLAKRDEHRETR